MYMPYFRAQSADQPYAANSRRRRDNHVLHVTDAMARVHHEFSIHYCRVIVLFVALFFI